MIVDRAWIERNIGVDPSSVPIPEKAFAVKAAASRSASLDDIQREIIDFNSEGSEGAAFMAFTKATGLSRFKDIPWPKGLAPKPASAAPDPATRRCRARMCSSSPGPSMKATRSAGC